MITINTTRVHPYLLRLFIIFLVLSCISVVSSCGTTGWKHGSERSKYTSLGWLKVTEYDRSAEYTGYQRLENEMAFDPSIKGFVNNHGIPDYLWVPERRQLYLAYLQEGIIYKFISISAYGSGEPLNIKYTDDSNLPRFLVEEFKKHDEALAKHDGSIEKKAAANIDAIPAESRPAAVQKGMFENVWEYYIHLKEYKALAIAYDNRYNWCGSIFSGIGRTKDYTQNTALFWCREKKQKYNIKSDCKVYALNNHLLFSFPEKDSDYFNISVSDERWAKNDPTLTTQFRSHEEAINHYEIRSKNRALVVAIKNELVAKQTEYIYGMSNNETSSSVAVDKATDECNRNRETFNVVSPCYLVSVNDNYYYQKNNPKIAIAKTKVPEPKYSEKPPQPTERKKPPQSITPHDSEKYTSTGTGFAVRGDGVILTAYHVVMGSKSIVVELNDGSRHEAKLVKFSRNNDLAILKIKKSTPHFLELEESGDIRAGDHVFTVGFPVIEILGKKPKYTDGTISSLSGIADEAALMQVSVPIQPGNSGGPLVNDKGKVVGVVTSTAAVSAFLKITGTLPQNVNWVINADYARPLFDKPVTKKQKRSDKSEIVDRTRKSVCLIMVDKEKKEVKEAKKEEVKNKEANVEWKSLGTNSSGEFYYDVNSVQYDTSTSFSVWTKVRLQGNEKRERIRHVSKYTTRSEALEYILGYTEVDSFRKMWRQNVISYVDERYVVLYTWNGTGKWQYIPTNSILDRMMKEINRNQ